MKLVLNIIFKYKNFAKSLVYHNSALNKQLVFVQIHSEEVEHPIKDHYFLGVLDFMSKKITILDSLGKNRSTLHYRLTFYALLHLANIISNTGNIKFEHFDWSLILSNDCSQQSDGCSCGLFVILNIAFILIGHQLFSIKDTKLARH